MAIVAEGDRGRVYLSPTLEMEQVAHSAADIPVVAEARETFLSGSTPTRAMITGGVCSAYGLSTWGHLFTPRQLVALTTFSDLVQRARAETLRDALAASKDDDGVPLSKNGEGATAYADAIAMYLAIAISKLADRGSSICTWDASRESIRNTFGRQAIPMTWDFSETNVLADHSGSYLNAIDQVQKVVATLGRTPMPGTSFQADATSQKGSVDRIISTDPPYYDNIGYADLSDYFYLWLRNSLKSIFPEILSTLVAPKAGELVATIYRHGSKERAEAFFLQGMTEALARLADQQHPTFPVTIYYAFKQSEGAEHDGITSTGWETFLAAVMDAGFSVSGTWPLRTELATRMISSGTNALASSILLVCRPRRIESPTATRREFVNELRTELPRALIDMQRGNIAPVDLAQAAIGPGMAVFTRYREVIDAEGKPLSVRQALALINQVLDEVQAAQEGDFDAETRWAITWFEQDGFNEGDYGVAETLSTSKNTIVAGMVEAGIIESGRGKVRLLRPSELDPQWDPLTDYRRTVWEMTHHLIRALETGGESAAASLAARIGAQAETARELAYRLYTVSERKKRAADALSYNSLVQSWPEIMRQAQERRPAEQPAQAGLL